MPRLVQVDKTQPLEIVPQERSVWLCQCGLTQNGPYCDGSHMRTIQEDPTKTYVYHKITQKVLTNSLSINDLITLKGQTEKVVYKNGLISIVKFRGSNNRMEEVRSIRKNRYPFSQDDEYDQDAWHYLYYEANEAQATMRVQLAAEQTLDCESYYPDEIFQLYRREQIASATRLVKRKDGLKDRKHIMKFIHEVWRDQLSNGVHIHVINAHRQMQRYYHWLGYETMIGQDFVHPRLNTPSVVLQADLLSDSFEEWRKTNNTYR